MTQRDIPDSTSLPVPPAPDEETAPSAAAISSDSHPLQPSALGSGLLAAQPTPAAEETIAVTRVCPQCGSEYDTSDRFCPKDGASLHPKTIGDPLIGHVIADRYLVLSKIGEGGMGRVYLAEHVKMTRQCAIKIMNPALMNDAQAVTRFAREASSAARIIHPNVAAVFDFGEAERLVYLVMEYVDGESLSALLARERVIEPRRAIDIAAQIAEGLAAAHELGIVHRDLKPDNVIITRTKAGREVAKVVDFGIAKAVSDSPKDALTRSGLVIGTPEYMAPEQLLGDPTDPRADIYSLGCILYQMLTGRQPFAAETREQMIRRRLHESPPHVRDVHPELPRRIDTLIVHMLARSPADRTATAIEVRDSLDPALALGGWDPSAFGGALAESFAATAHDPTLQPTVPMARSQRPRGKAAALVAVGGAALLGVLTLTPRFETKPPAPKALAPSPRPVAPDTDTAIDSEPIDPPMVQARDTAPKKTITPVIAVVKPKAPPVGPGTSARPTQQTSRAQSQEDNGISATLDRFRAASARGDIVALRDAAPPISATQLVPFQRVYQTGENIKATSQIGNVTISGDRAEVPFTLTLLYLDKTSKMQSSVRLQYNVVLARHGATWAIAELRNRAP